MKNKKRILRIATFFSILMFLLIPLLSTPVAAAFTTTISCQTDNSSEGPTVSITIPSGPYPIEYPDNTPRNATFKYVCDFKDTNLGGTGSWHSASIYVVQTAPGGGDKLNSTGIKLLDSDSSLPITLYVWFDWLPNSYYEWHIIVSVWCQDLVTMEEAFDEKEYEVCVDAT